MKAVGIRRFGGREVLEILELPKPQPNPHEVLVKVHAAGVNPVDWKIREGLLEGRMPHAFPIVLGWDAAGVIEAVGEKVHYARPGDAVFAYCRKDIIQDGSYAEYIVLRHPHLAPKPSNLSFEEAAAVPLAALTAYQALFEGLKLKAGEKVLIHAGAGGVGGFAIQLAKDTGAHVLTTSSARHHDYLRGLGVDETLDYTRESFVAAVRRSHPEGLDAVFDTVGGQVQIDSADVLRPGGRLTSILALKEDYFRKRGLETAYVFVRPDPDQLNLLKTLAEAGRLRVKLAAVLPLEEAEQAHELIQTGHTEGKIILKVSD
ncbi:MAG: NADP-dependent oxidoreductase [bacterium]